jgi:hypothetical protein
MDQVGTIEAIRDGIGAQVKNFGGKADAAVFRCLLYRKVKILGEIG